MVEVSTVIWTHWFLIFVSHFMLVLSYLSVFRGNLAVCGVILIEIVCCQKYYFSLCVTLLRLKKNILIGTWKSVNRMFTHHLHCIVSIER